MTALLLVFLASLVAPQQLAPVGGIRGEVRGEGGVVLEHATVEVVGSGRAALTERRGRYHLERIPSGRQVVRASRIGYALMEVEVVVPVGADLVLDLSLALRPLSLLPVEVSGERGAVNAGDTLRAPVPDMAMVGVRAVDTPPGFAELGLGAQIGMPGGADPEDPSDILFVRGSAAELKLVMLDGAPVYSPFHLGGLLQSFDPYLLQSARLRSGGASARVDGGLSHVLEMETRQGRRGGMQGAITLDALSGAAVTEGSLGQDLRVLAAGRAVHRHGLRFLADSDLAYDYHDALLRLDGSLSFGEVGLTFFQNRETIVLDSVFGELSEQAAWGNTALSLRFLTRVAGTSLATNLAGSVFDTHLPLGGEVPALVSGRAERLRFAADLTSPGGSVRYGLSAERVQMEHRASTFQDIGRADARAVGVTGGVYAENDWWVSRWLVVRSGGRLDFFDGETKPRFAPRLQTTWLVTDHAALTVGGGIFHQHVRPVYSSPAASDTAHFDPRRFFRELALASASHLTVSFDQRLDEGLNMAIEGHFKRFQGASSEHQLDANSSGVDLSLRRSEGRLTGWVGYSLGWLWAIRPGELTSGEFSGRHVLSVGGRADVGNGRAELRLAYGAGLPYTPIGPPSIGTMPEDVRPALMASMLDTTAPDPAPPAAPDENFLRIDFEVAQRYRGQWRGIAVDITPYLRVLNALDRRDALFYRYDSIAGGVPRGIGTLPIVPVAGFVWRF
jgi:hypothetical protein